jgi:hypothetical protein
LATDCDGCERGVGPGLVGNADVDCCDRSFGIVVEADGVLLPNAEGGLRLRTEGGLKPDVLLPSPSGDGCP